MLFEAVEIFPSDATVFKQHNHAVSGDIQRRAQPRRVAVLLADRLRHDRFPRHHRILSSS